MGEPAAFFETPRLRARAFTLADLDEFVAYRADPDVARYQSWSDYTAGAGRALIASMQGLARLSGDRGVATRVALGLPVGSPFAADSGKGSKS